MEVMASEATHPSAIVPVGATAAEVAAQPPIRANSLWRFTAIGGRLTVALIGIGLQAFIIFAGVTWATSAASWLTALSAVVSLIALLSVVHSRRPMDYKLIWAVLVTAMPFAGSLIYLVYGNRTASKRVRERQAEIKSRTLAAEVAAPGVLDSHEVAEFANPRAGQQMSYLTNVGPFVPFTGTATTYYPLGEAMFVDMLAALESAERYILIEYFIISEGHMFDALFDVLSRKARQGVDVMFLYDDIGSMWKLPAGVVKRSREVGIKIKAVNRFSPGNLRFNNRDHRKLLVVDGRVGFTGGINIGDEYINIVDRFGHWKDTGVKLEGPGVWGLVGLFFALWDQLTGQNTEFAHLRPDWPDADAPGIVVNFDDSPYDDISVGWGAYRNMMTRAQHTVDIMTPYLIPSQGQIESIQAIAQAGVRVRMITPGVPDKKLVFEVTRSNYQPLIEAGVAIYEYTPGFMHAKQMVADHDFAIIGTVNFDFRSFFLHQENAVWMHDTTAIDDMIRDFDECIALSRRVTLAEVQAVGRVRRLWRSVLRTFGPML